ncbi:MAG: RluA family pseudouridine synthase [Mariprofundaceae bacterium]
MSNFQDFSLIFPDQVEATRLDQFLAENLPLPKTRISQAIKNGGAYVNRKRRHDTGLLLKGGEKIRIVILNDEKLIPFSGKQIIWQQPPFFLIHKKTGQYAQEALHRSRGTLPEELSRHLKLTPSEAENLRPVHRLDRDTSGLMLFCSDPGQLQQIQSLWHSHVKKSYLAVVSPGPDWEKKRIRLPIGKRRDRLGRYHVDKNGKACDTEAEVIQREGDKALLKLTPHTGRTHQLRIHLSHLECPILGDNRYGGEKHPRLMLHAHSLCVLVPALSENHEWIADTEEDWQWQ